MLQRAFPASPQIPEDQYSSDELINWCGINPAVRRPSILLANLRSRHQAVRKSHAPWPLPRGRLAIVAIAGNKAADSPNSITDRYRRAANVQHGQHADSVLACQQQQGCDSGDKSSEPRKTLSKPPKQIDQASR